MNLLKEFQEFVRAENLFLPNHKLLIGVSGGLDSMVLLRLLQKSGYIFEVAHVNYQLRGDESKEDALFVSNYCKEHAIPFHLKNINTADLQLASGIGIQELAREIRYFWFNELCAFHEFDFILTAHHANDQAETILHRFLRGSGSKGLMGMKPKNNKLIRPLLFATKSELLSFAENELVLFRQDSSNLKSDYTRNYLRNQLIPGIKQIQPSIQEILVQTGKIMEMTNHYFQLQIEQLKKELVAYHHLGYDIDIKLLGQKPYPAYLLFELISKDDFNLRQCEEIIQAYENKHSGAIFHSSKAKAILNRTVLELAYPIENQNHFIISHLPFEIKLPWASYEFSLAPFDGFAKDTFWVNHHKINLPMLANFEYQGKSFQPLGMTGKQKISDFFINHKIGGFEKSRAMVLEQNGDIIALLPYRISERYKIPEPQGEYLKICIKKSGQL